MRSPCTTCGTPLTMLGRCPKCTRIEWNTKQKKFLLIDTKTGAVLGKGNSKVSAIQSNGYPAFTNQPEPPQEEDGPETWYSDIWD